jgi:small subunit ribosomal protein S5
MDNSQEKERKTTKSRQQRAPRERWNERVVQISRVTKVCKGGKKLSFRAVVIIGNENGQVGLGIGKADDVLEGVKKAVNNAKRNLIQVPITKNFSIPHKVVGKYGAANVIIKPATVGSGVLAGGSVRTVLELSGIQNISAKQLGCNNLLNNARAAVCALNSIKTESVLQ